MPNSRKIPWCVANLVPDRRAPGCWCSTVRVCPHASTAAFRGERCPFLRRLSPSCVPSSRQAVRVDFHRWSLSMTRQPKPNWTFIDFNLNIGYYCNYLLFLFFSYLFISRLNSLIMFFDEFISIFNFLIWFINLLIVNFNSSIQICYCNNNDRNKSFRPMIINTILLYYYVLNLIVRSLKKKLSKNPCIWNIQSK